MTIRDVVAITLMKMSSMRLRLRILRNQLPPVTTLWPVTDTQQKNTITQLLESVNAIFPLESESWGIEHYVVTVASFECLHYHEIGAVCKDEDEVVIRPLSYAEVRARMVLGRDQISFDGRHLYDGLPYGRPMLRGVVRPEVRIPPRKRMRLIEDAVPQAGDGTIVPFQDVEEDDEDEDEDEDEEDDEDYQMDDEVSDGDTEEDANEEESSEDDSEDSSEEGESSDSDTSSTSDDSSDSDSSESESEWNGIQSGSSSPAKQAATKTALGSRMTLPNAQKGGRDSHDSLTASESVSLKRKAPSSQDDSSLNPQPPSKAGKVVGTPFQGKPETSVRNARRRDSKKLAHLKQVGVLHKDANLADLREWEAGGKHAAGQVQATSAAEIQVNDPAAELLNNAEEAAAAAEKDTSTETFGRSSDAEDRAGAVDSDEEEAPEEQKNETAKRLEEERQKLLSQIATGGIEVGEKKRRNRKRGASQPDEDAHISETQNSRQDSAAGSAEPPSAELQDTETMAGAPKPGKPSATDMIPSSVARRSKLDLAGSKRLLFGSLGVRVPKTQEEKDALQKKLTARAQQRMAPPPDPEAPAVAPKPVQPEQKEPEPEAETELDENWWDKIELSAVECCEEGVTLSTPPFPFYQRWDPQQRRKKSKARTGKAYMAGPGAQQVKGKLQKNKPKDSVAAGRFVETYDKYNENGEGDALDYDDAVDQEDEYWEEGALIGDEEYEDEDEEYDEDGADQQLRGEAAKGEIDDGFPSLPADIVTLPSHPEAQAKRDDFVVYQELVCSAATGWQPKMLTRTVQLLDKEDGGWRVKMAMRDLRPKEFDQEGNRIYSKFEMEGMSDDEEENDEDGVKTLQWTELVEPRLLKRGDGAEAA